LHAEATKNQWQQQNLNKENHVAHRVSLTALVAMSIATAAVATLSCQSRSYTAAKPNAEFRRDGIPVDWGNLNSDPLSGNDMGTRGREAVLANAAVAALNRAAVLQTLVDGMPQSAQMLDGIVSSPVHFLANDEDPTNHPFGDGQKNASFDWPSWPAPQSRPPLVMTLVRSNAGLGRAIVHLLIVEVAAEVFAGAAAQPETINAQIADDAANNLNFTVVKDASRRMYRGILVLGEPSGQLVAKDSYPAAIVAAPQWLSVLTDGFAWPRIKLRLGGQSVIQGGAGWYPVLFRFPSQTKQQANASLPPNQNSFQGKPLSDPPYDAVAGVPATTLLKRWFDAQPADSKLAEFFESVAGQGVHYQFKDSTGSITKTATGGVDTYVIKSLIGNTQLLYTCFDARSPANEAQLGVPSGAGWHSIGHPLPEGQGDRTFAETVVNGFENSGIFAGWGVRTPNPFQEDAAFGSKDVATFRVLRSGEAFTTARSHFHWYAVDASQKVCTTIWKHLRCELRSDRDLKCNQ
jgi:hypothetical protein